MSNRKDFRDISRNWPSMELAPWLILFSCFVQASAILADMNAQDTAGLVGIAASWNTKPSNWGGDDPCGEKWFGIIWSGDRVISMGTTWNTFRRHSVFVGITVDGFIPEQEPGCSLPSSIGTLSNLQNFGVVKLGGAQFSIP